MPIWVSRLLRVVAIAALIAGPVGGIWSPSSVEAEGAGSLRDDAVVYQRDDVPQVPQTVGGGMIMAPGTSSPRAGDFQTNAIGPWITTLNELRALANLPGVADNDAWTQSETNHSKYI